MPTLDDLAISMAVLSLAAAVVRVLGYALR